MGDTPAWKSFETSTLKQLTTASKSISIGARILCLKNMLYDCALSAFGAKVHSTKQPNNFSSFYKHKTVCLVKTKNDLLVRIQLSCDPCEQLGLSHLLSETRAELRKLRKKQNRRKRNWLKKQQRKSFKVNPYKCGKDLLTPKNFSKLAIPKAELDVILKALHSDPLKDDPLPPLDGLPEPPVIKVKFDGSSFSFDDFQSLLRTRRNGSRPGPNQIPYKVYKKCPGVAKYLFQLLLDCLRLRRVPVQWRVAFKTFIPKVDTPDPAKFSDFRDISLLNVEGKMFFSLVSNRITKHLINRNQVINSSIQKGLWKVCQAVGSILP